MNLEFPRQLVHYAGRGIAEGSLFNPTLANFSDYVAFEAALKSGSTPEQAAGIARVQKPGVEAVSSPPSPSTPAPKKKGVGLGGLLNKGIAGVFGDDTDF